MSGEVRIGASTIPGTYILPGLLSSFHRQYPDVKAFVPISSSRAIAAKVIDSEFDLGLVGAIWNERGLEWTTLFTDTLVLAVHPDNPLAARPSLAINELFNHPFILREPGSGTRKVLARILEQQGYREADLQDVAVLGSNEAIKAVKADIGISMLSGRSIAEDVQGHKLAAIPLENVATDRPIFLIQRKNREPSPVAAALIEFLRAVGEQDNPTGGRK